MMPVLRPLVAATVALALATSPLLAQSAPGAPPQSAPHVDRPRPSRPMVYTGAALFGAGLSTALYGFIRVGNGHYATFGEATSRNKPLGAAGMAAAFAGGALMFLGTRTKLAPSAVVVSPSEVSVARRISW